MRTIITIQTILLLACNKPGSTDCPTGSEGCDCTLGGACDTGLVCDDGICVGDSDGSTDTTGDLGTDTEHTDTPAETECTVDLDCDDDDPCTMDACDSLGDCLNVPLDEDEDGYVAMSAGSVDCGGEDCDDSDDGIFPGAPELDCYDEVDHDCMGTIGLVEMQEPVDFHETDNANDFHIAWSGSLYGIVIDEVPDVVFTRIDPSGATIGSEVIFPGDRRPEIVWTGSLFGVTWHGMDSLELAMFGPDGTMTTPVSLSTDITAHNRSAWTGSEIGVIWMENDTSPPRRVYFTRVDGEGLEIGSETMVIEDYSGEPEAKVLDLSWSGSEYALLFQSNPDGPPTVHRFDATGTSLGSWVFPHMIDVEEHNPVLLVWTGSEHGFISNTGCTPSNTLCLHRYQIDGTVIGSGVSLGFTSTDGPSMIWTGTGFVVANESMGMGIQISPIGPEGTLTGDTFTDSRWASTPEMVWTGSEVGTIWKTYSSGGTPANLSFASVGWCF